MPPTPEGVVRDAVAAVLAFVGRPELQVSLLLTDDAEIAALHGTFLGDPTPTDVMSFPMDDGIDVVVSVECARREAAARGHAWQAELSLYVVHGILHACGYDDVDECERARMRAAEARVLESLSLHVDDVDDVDQSRGASE
ncbi:MAG: rRNA maturation RNase YbeY [Planctomycetes bacterium]|nr:rRNA maturation RNase YbeY [Planctomycetota bacterium]